MTKSWNYRTLVGMWKIHTLAGIMVHKLWIIKNIIRVPSCSRSASPVLTGLIPRASTAAVQHTNDIHRRPQIGIGIQHHLHLTQTNAAMSGKCVQENSDLRHNYLLRGAVVTRYKNMGHSIHLFIYCTCDVAVTQGGKIKSTGEAKDEA